MTVLHPTFHSILPVDATPFFDVVDTIEDTLHAALLPVGDHVRIDRARFEPLVSQLVREARVVSPAGATLPERAEHIGDTFYASWTLPVIGGPWIHRPSMLLKLRELRAEAMLLRNR